MKEPEEDGSEEEDEVDDGADNYEWPGEWTNPDANDRFY
jgi:hypothetical protein